MQNYEFISFFIKNIQSEHYFLTFLIQNYSIILNIIGVLIILLSLLLVFKKSSKKVKRIRIVSLIGLLFLLWASIFIPFLTYGYQDFEKDLNSYSNAFIKNNPKYNLEKLNKEKVMFKNNLFLDKDGNYKDVITWDMVLNIDVDKIGKVIEEKPILKDNNVIQGEKY